MTDQKTEQGEKEAIKQAFEELAGKWEGSEYMNSASPQLSHIRNCPEVTQMVRLGKDVLPLVYEKLKENILYCIIFEKILFNEDIELVIDEKIPHTEGRWGYFEPKRQAYLKWWESQQNKG